MPEKVIDLAEWKAAHPPLIRLWSIHCHVVAAWWGLMFSVWRR